MNELWLGLSNTKVDKDFRIGVTVAYTQMDSRGHTRNVASCVPNFRALEKETVIERTIICDNN
jgi:hypothetical protein